MDILNTTDQQGIFFYMFDFIICFCMVFPSVTWSSLQLHGLPFSGMVLPSVAWSSLQWHGPPFSGMVLLSVAWSSLQWHGLPFSDMVFH